jgi:hypothetical protein
VAVLTTAEAKTFLRGIASGSSSQDTLIDTLVTRADQVLSRWCGYPAYTDGAAGATTFEDQSYTLYMSGPGGRSLKLPVYPISSVTSIEDDSTEAFDGSTYLVASGDYTTRKSEGVVLLTPTSVHGEWSDTSSPVLKVVVVAGWSTVPEQLKQACGEMVKHLWEMREKSGEQSRSQQGISVSYRDEQIPPHLRAILSPYRLRGVWFG